MPRTEPNRTENKYHCLLCRREGPSILLHSEAFVQPPKVLSSLSDFGLMDWQRNRRNSPPHFVDPCNDDCLESGFKQWQPGFASGVERSRVQSKKVWQEQQDMHLGRAQLSDVRTCAANGRGKKKNFVCLCWALSQVVMHLTQRRRT